MKHLGSENLTLNQYPTLAVAVPPTGKSLTPQSAVLYPEKEYEYDDDYSGMYSSRSWRKARWMSRGWEASSPERGH